MLGDLGTQAFNALKHNRRRSLLTMLGMAWGIATVVLLLAYGTGFQEGPTGDTCQGDVGSLGAHPAALGFATGHA